MSNETADKCRAIWLQAEHDPVTLYFGNVKELRRARFALYSAVAKRKLEKDIELSRLREGLELVMDTKKLTLTLQSKDINPFYANFEAQLNQALSGDISSPNSDEVIGASLANLQDRLAPRDKMDDGVGDAVRPDTPFFPRSE